VAVVVAAAGIPDALVSMRADRAPILGRPELQRILDELTSGRGRIAPGATANVAGPRGSWSGAAGVAHAATGEPMPVSARMRLESVSKIWTACWSCNWSSKAGSASRTRWSAGCRACCPSGTGSPSGNC
jgi:hypothetical protein